MFCLTIIIIDHKEKKILLSITEYYHLQVKEKKNRFGFKFLSVLLKMASKRFKILA